MNSPAVSSSSRGLRTVFLDRDGVINEKMPEGSYVRSLAELNLLDGVAEAIARLNRAGFRVIVVSNQRGVALGLYTTDDVLAIQAEIERQLEDHGAHLDGFYFCPHDKGECNCRKPLPGLFEQAVSDHPDISAATSVIIGDSLSDIEFGRHLGMQTIFLEGVPTTRKPGTNHARELADERYGSLADAINGLLSDRTHREDESAQARTS